MYFSVLEVREKATDGANTNTTQNHIQINSPYAAIVLQTKHREPEKYIVLGDGEQATDGPTPPHRSTSRSIHLVLLKTKCRGPEKYFVLGDRQQQLVPTPPPPHMQIHVQINSPCATKDKLQRTWKILCPRRQQATVGANTTTTTQIYVQINSPYTTEDKVRRTWKIHCPSRGSFEEWVHLALTEILFSFCLL